MIFASKFVQIECVKTLLENGASINSQCIHGFSPLMWAADNGQIEIVEVFINDGASLDSKDHYGWTALMKAVSKKHGDIV